MVIYSEDTHLVIEINIYEQMCDICVNDMNRCETKKCLFNNIRKRKDVIFRRNKKADERKKNVISILLSLLL
jgi:hypothetical protein